MAEMKELPLRLAFRVEGNWWNAYIAASDTMDGARQIGSILMVAVHNEDRKNAFMRLMEDVMADVLQHTLGSRPEFGNLRQAPENERSGTA